MKVEVTELEAWPKRSRTCAVNVLAPSGRRDCGVNVAVPVAMSNAKRPPTLMLFSNAARE